MKPANVLLLDINPSSELSGKLRGILESTPNGEIQLQQEIINSSDTRDLPGGDVRDLVSRAKPAVIFLVSAWNVLRRAKALFQSLRREPPEPPIVVVSDADAPEMFDMIRLGAADFITPPLTPMGILPRLWRLLEQTVRGETLGYRLKEKFVGTNMLIGESPAFLEVVKKIPTIAPGDTTILISGETGTGKEVCARSIHRLSQRAERSFVAVNCGSIPIDLVESELFGHERGAFTGAVASKIGMIHEAEGGTLFLDELDSLPLLAQVKLLRFLQEKEYRAVGSTKTRYADVRVIAATNVNIDKAVREGKIRQDLYYRLNMIPIALPPLRERREDIPLLAATFLAQFAKKYGKHVYGFSSDALHKLCLYDWPGNVRELESVVGRALTFVEQPLIHSQDISLPGPAPKSFQEMKEEMVQQFERTYIQSMLIAFDGNITKAAEAAQKDRRSFFELIRKLGIDVERFRTKK
ncbi:MAG: sigma-54 dependent transcriptional regulator [Acidobacteria bacterium]|nr:sigma-54 dependent transcriptional regulator [Acidobacteriota bacterium]